MYVDIPNAICLTHVFHLWPPKKNEKKKFDDNAFPAMLVHVSLAFIFLTHHGYVHHGFCHSFIKSTNKIVKAQR